ncbi:Crp/Fnr family transcriptional regulator [Pontibacter roseus]|uniref:Crp/Fnr family transcriptional regulator n=1 Tax=Pontibacter roseus TaxID=336989 RepID=UPI0004771926|nr:Crp/Fnr family transcriptional regulator [Pontibacter roseus]
MPDALQGLRQVVNAIRPLTEADWEAFASIWKPLSARRKEPLTSMGVREHYLYFVLEGVQRVYYFDEHSREATLVFTYAPSFGGVLDSFMLQQPSRYYYETLTPSVFLRASFTDLQHVMEARPAVESMIREGITHSLSGLLERLVELQCYTSEERFRILLRRSPHLLQLVPHKYLANYLGIDATNFSKLLNKVRI